MNNQKNNWITAIGLCLPIAVFFVAYLLNHSARLTPTGFIQYDNVAYIAYAKQYLDAGSFSLFYSNPFAIETPSIYFQPQTIFFALLMKSGIPPGWILIPFTLICSVIVFRLLIAIYDHLAYKAPYRNWNLWLLGWGGGLLAVAGIAAHFYLHKNVELYRDLFLVDPEGGWWGLNLGRSLIFSCESYYHALFLGCILSVLKKRWKTAILLMFILSLSHPFTGLELTSIVCVWGVIERMTQKNEVPLWFVVISLIILAFHVYYYLVYLDKFQDHHSVSTQYSLNWRLRFYRMIPAYFLVAALSLVTFIKTGWRKFFEIRSNRILIAWFAIAFLLANHEIFISPKQPVHFTRGYIWTSLFLLGLPYLIQLNKIVSQRWKTTGWLAIALLFFADNFLWITINSLKTSNQDDATYITSDQRNVLNLLDRETSNQTLIISQDKTIAYLSSVYTRGTPWYSHPFTTPEAKFKKFQEQTFFTTGQVQDSWKEKNIAVVVDRTDSAIIRSLGTYKEAKRIDSDGYSIFLFHQLK